MNIKRSFIRYISLALCLCLIFGALSLVSCSDDTSNDEPVKDNTDQSNNDTPDNITDFDPSILDSSTTIHMIQSSESLQSWQSGKTVYDVFFYVDDMMELLDSLDWKTAEQVTLVGDFHFRIDIERPIEEIADFEKFLLSTEPPLDTIFTVSEDNDKLGVQYLINFDEGIVNMKLSSYSMQVFSVYAELDENELKILELCLKAYFGPHGK